MVRFAQVPLHGLYFLRALFFAALIEGVLASALNNAILSPGGAAFWPGFQMRAIAHVVGIFIVTPVFTALGALQAEPPVDGAARPNA